MLQVLAFRIFVHLSFRARESSRMAPPFGSNAARQLFPGPISKASPLSPGSTSSSSANGENGFVSEGGCWSSISRSECRAILHNDPDEIVLAVDPTVRSESSAASPITLNSKLTLLHLKQPSLGPALEDFVTDRNNAIAVECGKVCFHKATDAMNVLVQQLKLQDTLKIAKLKTYLDVVRYLEEKEDYCLSLLLRAVDEEMRTTTGIEDLQQLAKLFIRCVKRRDTHAHFTQMTREEREKRIVWLEKAMNGGSLSLSPELLRCSPAIRHGWKLIRDGYFDYRSDENVRVRVKRMGIELEEYISHGIDTELPLLKLMPRAIQLMMSVDGDESDEIEAVDLLELHCTGDKFFYYLDGTNPVLAGFWKSDQLVIAVANLVMEFSMQSGSFILKREKLEVPEPATSTAVLPAGSLVEGLAGLLEHGVALMIGGKHAAPASWFIAQAGGMCWGWQEEFMFAGSFLGNAALLLTSQLLFLLLARVTGTDLASSRESGRCESLLLLGSPTGLASGVAKALKLVEKIETILGFPDPPLNHVKEIVDVAEAWSPSISFLAKFVEDAIRATMEWVDSGKSFSKKRMRETISELRVMMLSHGIRATGEVCGVKVLEEETERKREEEMEKRKKAAEIREARAAKKIRVKDKIDKLSRNG